MLTSQFSEVIVVNYALLVLYLITAVSSLVAAAFFINVGGKPIISVMLGRKAPLEKHKPLILIVSLAIWVTSGILLFIIFFRVAQIEG